MIKPRAIGLRNYPHILWVYRLIPRTVTKETPFSLVYGVEVVIPVEIQISSFRHSTLRFQKTLKKFNLIWIK